jgi:hypothetical protein
MVDFVNDHQLRRLPVQQPQAEQFHVGAAAIDGRLNTQTFDDLRIEFVVARIRGHLKVNCLSDFNLIAMLPRMPAVCLGPLELDRAP